jgi:hypothetical protein
MFFPTRSHCVAILALVIASAGSGARAGFNTETFTVSTPVNQKTDFSQTLAVPAFNVAGATLSTVTFSFSDEANISGYLINKSAGAKDFAISDTVSFRASFLTYGLSDTREASQTYPGLTTGSTAIFGAYALKGNSGTTSLINPTDLVNFEGTSPLEFNFSAVAQVVNPNGGGNSTLLVNTRADSTLTITYGYISPNITPEPASLAMTALGGLLVAATVYVGKRKKARAVAGR